ncbi:MAG TPA: NUMOD1 domain-containing DNA-binding protein [Chitinophagaceae bacterium]
MGKVIIKKYPFQNKSLKDLLGEKWKEIPEWENYEVSNYGRVKASGQWVSLNFGKDGYRKEKILWQQVITIESLYNGDTLNYLAFGVQQDNYRKVFRTARLVYYLFIKQFQIDEIKQIIQYRDGDGLNIHPSNLILTTNSVKMKKTIEKGRTPRIQKVTQFNLDGNKVRTYNSMNEAAVALGGHPSRIYAVLDKWPHYYKGYLWQKGDLKKTKPLAKPLTNYPKKVIQLSLKGKQLKIFPSLNQAATKVGATNSNLRKVLKKKCHTCKGYKWKWG